MTNREKMNDRIKYHPVQIISGEGEAETRELYEGTRTSRAIKRRLSRERRSGCRVRALVYDHSNGCDDDSEAFGIDVEKGGMEEWHWIE